MKVYCRCRRASVARLALAWLGTVALVSAAEMLEPVHFDVVSGPAASTVYSTETGYGFDPGTKPDCAKPFFTLSLDIVSAPAIPTVFLAGDSLSITFYEALGPEKSWLA